MNNSPVLATGAQRQPARPQSLAEARAGIDATIAAQPLSKGSGYVRVDDNHFHVAKTSMGPIVSLVQWKVEQGERPGYAPVHDLFSVNLDARDKAVLAWNNRHPKVEEASDIKASAPAAPSHLAPPTPMKPARSGARQ